ncbi:response regulator [Ancylothrix sp. C2]|uniref:hybrid sensor histidine kinase/response regulator n=1 Tax=Ancylothrix sp. D3o TaxID=2953691 RepID=UPI0021BB6BBA|nr:response regulator [Ancylothrix sp. D3o]MCT7950966.1 response regulator [Ancylothrix sp. D3o]
MNSQSLDRGNILIVDDTPTNLGSVLDFLSSAGFTVWVARSGPSALKKVQYSQPDLILLDVLMPEMDGFETCQHLKANELTKDIPVIFMTALDDTESKVKGFNVGAVDYITKPLQHEEVLARATTHLNLRNLTKKLQAQIVERERAQADLQVLAQELEARVEARTIELSQANEWLKQEIVERKLAEAALQASEARERQKALQLENSLRELSQVQRQLIQSEKMSALGQLVAGVAHEINNPVNFIYGNLTYALEYSKNLINILELYEKYYPNPPEEIQEESEVKEIDFIKNDFPKMFKSMQLGADRIREIVLSLRHFARQEAFEMSVVNLHEGIDSTLMILHSRLKFKSDYPAIKVVREYSSNLPQVECYAGEMNQVFMNILVNAIDALEEWNKQRSPKEIEENPSVICISTQVTSNNGVTIRIKDNGPGISDEVRRHVFNPFFTTKPPGKGTGIGLSISWQIIVEKHGGILECVSVPGSGTEFTIQIPIRHQSQILSISA